MAVESVDAVVVGAGPAGLCASWSLSRRGVAHLVLEQGEVGDSWRTQRWDSFRLVTPADQVRLPPPAGTAAGGEEFLDAGAVVRRLESLAGTLPVRTGVRVLSATGGDGAYHLQTSTAPVATRAVVVASGGLRRPYVPGLASRLPRWLPAWHSADYRRPEQLPDGAVLVVGSGQSGCQIAAELAGAGRRVLLATSRVGYLPRRYRGRDVTGWAARTGLYDEPPATVEPGVRAEPQPIMTGRDGGRTLTLPQLARDGVQLAGRFTGADEDTLWFADDLFGNIAFSQAYADRMCRRLDVLIDAQGLSAPPAEQDPCAAVPDDLDAGPRHLDAAREGFTAVVWATGYRPAHDWLRLPVVDERGRIRHDAGATPEAGVHVVGYPWQSHRASGLLYGMALDAERAAAGIAAHLAGAAG